MDFDKLLKQLSSGLFLRLGILVLLTNSSEHLFFALFTLVL